MYHVFMKLTAGFSPAQTASCLFPQSNRKLSPFHTHTHTDDCRHWNYQHVRTLHSFFININYASFYAHLHNNPQIPPKSFFLKNCLRNYLSIKRQRRIWKKLVHHIYLNCLPSIVLNTHYCQHLPWRGKTSYSKRCSSDTYGFLMISGGRS